MKRKKTIRNIVIAAVVVVVIVAAVVLGLSLRKDGRGMNAFERSRVAATANGTSITMLDYAMTFDTLAQNYSSSSLTDEQVKSLQENAATQALMMKIYTKEAKALGLTLTDEDIKACKTAAQQQIDGIVETYTQQLVNDGTYSKAALDKQIANYYAMLGMSQSKYYDYCLERIEANYYMDKLEEHYETEGSDLTEEDILAYYHETVDSVKENYMVGQYSTSMMMYQYGYSMPLLFVPDGFFYIDFIQITKQTEAEINDVFQQVLNGDVTFEELMASEENQNPYRDIVDGPYAIGENDHSYLFVNDDTFEAAKALEIGKIGTYVVPMKSTQDGEETVTGYNGYLFRRAEGTMCEEGETGTIKIDYYPGIRDSAENGLRQKRWMSDAVYTDAMYAYRGSF